MLIQRPVNVRPSYKNECIAQVNLLCWRLYGCRLELEDMDIEQIEITLRRFTKEWNERLTYR